MTGEQLEDLLRSHADPPEREYRYPALPPTVGAAQAKLSRRHSHALQMLAAGVGGAVAALALVLVAGLASGVLPPPRDAGGPNESVAPQSSEANPSRPCRSAHFNVRSEAWPDAPMAGGVLVIFEARPSARCVIDRGLYAHVSEANGRGLVGSATFMREPVEVEPGTALQVGISWSSYCGSAGGTVAAPEEPVRPLLLSVALGVKGDEVQGEEVTEPDILIPVGTPTEIAPAPCAEEFPGSPFWLVPTGFEPYPGPPPER